MIRIVPFEPEHLKTLELQDVQMVAGDNMTPEMASALATTGEAYSAIKGEKTIACAGLVPAQTGTATVWAMLGNTGPRDFYKLHCVIRRHLDLQDYRRIQTMVKSDHAEGHRWMRLLGFEWEGTLRCYGPDGADYDMYARIQ